MTELSTQQQNQQLQPQQQLSSAVRSTWASIAFIVESILLLVFLVASLAVLTQVFFSSLNRSVESRTLDAATIAASSIAEHFAADPTGVDGEVDLGDLRVTCEVSDEQRQGGTMYSAHIEVFDVSEAGGGAPVYSIDTSRYRAEGE